MSADPVAQILPQVDVVEVQQQVEVRTELHDTNQTTGVAQVHADTGFDGSGQTVVVIDSGIAYDHAALGGGFGAGYKVVGGWDFAENDADPYDDGPAGFHGTHVGGIIGSTDAWHTGVAPGADLVALRVFDDYGTGNLEWVEQALEWVHSHKDSFANPITTVNLSLGTDWNADNTPAWATLEDEFQQLEADGIFVSVAAGNDFQRYQTTGVSYPAASSYVVPIASSDGISSISDFSQRNDRVLVAPGEQIFSTVPDHLFGGSRTNQFLGASGTSMAAPYAAGASVLLRQAYQFMGMDNVTQSMLYQQFRATADLIYDAATSATYYQINLPRAIESVIPDVHGDTWADATNAGTLGAGEQIMGIIGSRSDSDKFVFTAAESGTMTLTFDTTDDLRAAVQVVGADATVEGNTVRFDVVQGQQYRFSVGTDSGIGHYRIDVAIEARDVATDWGRIRADAFRETVDGESLFRMEATRDGILTLHADVLQAQGPVTLELYDAQMNRIGIADSQTGELRLDVGAAEGQMFYLRAIGDAAQLDIAVLNLIQQSDARLSIFGTAGNDHVAMQIGDQVQVRIAGVEYEFDASELDVVRLVGMTGSDTLQLTTDTEMQQVDFRVGRTDVDLGTLDIVAFGFENVSADAVAGVVQARFHDSVGDDQFSSNAAMARMSGTGFVHTLRGLNAGGESTVIAFSDAGSDSATLFGTAGDDRMNALADRTIVKAGIDKWVLKSFEDLSVDGRGGHDVAVLHDTAGDDVFQLRPGSATVHAAGRSISASGFESVHAFASSGFDRVRFFDSAGDDLFAANSDGYRMAGSGFVHSARGFDVFSAFASQGNDRAVLRDSVWNDSLSINESSAMLTNQSFTAFASGFDRIAVVAGRGGYDTAVLRGTTGADQFFADANSVSAALSDGAVRRVVGFDEVDVQGLAGHDVGRMVGSSDVDLLQALREGTTFESTMQLVRLTQIEDQRFDGNGGGDEVYLEEFQALDLLRAVGDKAVAFLNRHRIEMAGFDYLQAETDAQSISQYDYDGVDYLFMLQGDWRER